MSLFEAVRKKCSASTWSRGVELTRADAVVGERASGDEIVVHVSTKGGLICPTVTLYPDDEEWECSCSSAESACEHVAAAVIALRRAEEEGRDLIASAASTGRVGYRFSRSGRAVALERVVMREGRPHVLETTLSAVASGRVGGPSFIATQADLRVELALGTHRRGVVPRQLWPKLLSALAPCGDIRLDDAPVRVSATPVVAQGRLDDQGDGFRLFIEDDPTLTEVFNNGVALCGDTLRAMGETRLTGRELYELPKGKFFGPGDIAELVTEILPSLMRRIPVDVRTARLPGIVSLRPRVVLDVRREDMMLSVLPTLVYGNPPMARIDGGRLVHLQGQVPLRDERAEQRLVRQLHSQLRLAPGIKSQFTGEEAVEFTIRLKSWTGEVQGKGQEVFFIAPPLVPRLRLEGREFDVSFEVSGSMELGRAVPQSADAGTVLRAWRQGASLVPLKDGGWSPLPDDWLQRFGHRIADLMAARDAGGELPRCALPDLARLCEELDHPIPPEFEGLKKLVEGFAEIPDAELPKDLSATLRRYQQEGVNWLSFLRRAGLGAMLADDMGLGKTLQALCAVQGRTLVVTPTSVLHNWLNEIRRFRPGLRYAVYHGRGRALDPAADVTLTTYTLLRMDDEILAGESWDTVVLDEAQAIKNPDSQVARAAYRLRVGFRITMSGTPVENRLDELWSQFHFINRGLLGGRQDFQERYARPIAEGQPGAASRLRERIRPFILRRLKREVAPELPPRTEAVLYCELVPAEREVYDAIRAATLSEVLRRLQVEGNVLAALETLLRLRQAACHPALIPGQQAETSSKVERLMEALDTVVADGHKALVFSQWTSFLDLVEPHLHAAAIDFVRLDGGTRDRSGVVSRFQDDAGPPVMLVSLKAGGTGLNLTAADHVFLLDPWWNPAVEDQAADRAHRIGQERPVLVYRLVAEETVEERILTLQESKRALSEAALGGGERAGSLSRDDLLALLA